MPSPQDDPTATTSASPYYASTATPRTPTPSLQGSTTCDVCIVGGGLAGLSAAIELRLHGFSVVVLERHEIGWGASGRNGGQVLAGLGCDMSVIEQQLGRNDARRVWDVSVEGLRMIGQRRVRHAIDCDWRQGVLAAAVSSRKAHELARSCEAQARHYGWSGVRMIDRGAIAAWIASARYVAAAYDTDADSGHLNPLKYTRGLADAAVSLGAAIHENSAVDAIDRGAAPVVRTRGGQVRCRHLLLAGNVYLDRLAPALARRIMPVGTFICASERLDPALAASLVPSGAAVYDTQVVLDYFRPTPDRRLLFGGRVSYSARTPANLGECMRRRMVTVFPQLGGVRVEHAWEGFVDITINRAPDFGRIDGNIYYLQGFSGHGVALTGIAGRMVAEAMAADARRFDLFARIRHRDFPGGELLRRPALVLAMLWYRIRDAVG